MLPGLFFQNVTSNVRESALAITGMTLTILCSRRNTSKSNGRSLWSNEGSNRWRQKDRHQNLRTRAQLAR